MSIRRHQPRGVHLVGSVPLANAEQVFRAAGTILGHHLRRMPDGETGERTFWAAFQIPRLAENPAFEGRGMTAIRAMLYAYSHWPPVRKTVNTLVARASARGRGGASILRIRPGVSTSEIRLGPLGYAAAAIESFATFQRLKHAGVIPAPVRFQVSLPTPIAVVNAFPPDQQALILPAYEARLSHEIQDMLSVIPAEQLSVQWDAAIEFAILEGVAPSHHGSPAEARAFLFDTLVRLGDAVPGAVEVGYHLCYGDAGHRHFVQPADTSRLVDAANYVAANLQRTLDWIHFPAPIDRHDDAYYAPLRDLRVPQETEVYAGVVHIADGAAGTRRRIEATQRALDREFGIATECGLGRRDPLTIMPLLELHAQLAGPVRAAVPA
jgi:hypothetical protein